MKVIAVIPARYASTRFPAKLLQDLGGKTVIQRTYEAAVQTNLFDDVFVVTDSELIYQEIISQGGKAVMSFMNTNRAAIVLQKQLHQWMWIS